VTLLPSSTSCMGSSSPRIGADWAPARSDAAHRPTDGEPFHRVTDRWHLLQEVTVVNKPSTKGVGECYMPPSYQSPMLVEERGWPKLLITARATP
jgi:hypothetical protein